MASNGFSKYCLRGCPFLKTSIRTVKEPWVLNYFMLRVAPGQLMRFLFPEYLSPQSNFESTQLAWIGGMSVTIRLSITGEIIFLAWGNCSITDPVSSLRLETILNFLFSERISQQRKISVTPTRIPWTFVANSIIRPSRTAHSPALSPIRKQSQKLMLDVPRSYRLNPERSPTNQKDILAECSHSCLQNPVTNVLRAQDMQKQNRCLATFVRRDSAVGIQLSFFLAYFLKTWPHCQLQPLLTAEKYS